MNILRFVLIISISLFLIGKIQSNSLDNVKNTEISKKPKIKYRGTGGYQRGSKNVYKIYSSRSQKMHKNIKKRPKQSYRLRARSSSSKGQMW